MWPIPLAWRLGARTRAMLRMIRSEEAHGDVLSVLSGSEKHSISMTSSGDLLAASIDLF